ncbi:MAG: FKBP-type peptidyl-prolyl cis-trans isomerase [Candidatus Saccharibacteria bacterium]
MATPRSQRIGIWVIAIIMICGTLGSFLAMALSVPNQKIDQAEQQKLNDEFQKIKTEYLAKVDAQTKELSDKYYPEFSQYSSVPAAFSSDGVKELKKNDLKVGDGEEIKTGTGYSAYYIGWNPKGVVFDQSIADGALKAPLASGGTIAGWEEGVIGMKIGGVRELTIPSDKAYGKTGQGDDIPPNTPLKFIVMLIPKVVEVPIPDVSKYIQQQ